MRYLYLLLVLATHPMTPALAALAFSPNELVSIKEATCERLAAFDTTEEIIAQRGPRIDFPTADGKGHINVVLRPSFQEWRVAIVTLSDSADLPVVEMRLARDCKVLRSRQITRRPDGKISKITDLDLNFLPNDKAQIQDPVHYFTAKAADRNPENPRIALVDTGVNYTLPAFQNYIALGSDGHLIGYDFWDDDEWPDDSDPRGNVFFPMHHGSTVFSVLSREAGDSTISIYRFPAEQMCRFSTLLEHIAKTPVRVVNLSMGSDDYEDWQCFETAARNLPDLLFVVSAGNNGRDIDVDPVYPASLALQNMIVVSSADAFGRLGQGSNYGRQNVDMLVPAEDIEVIDHRGARARTGGTSYAAPRVSALLSRYLARNPAASIEDLIVFLRKRAIPSSGQHSKYGWIPDPTDDFGF